MELDLAAQTVRQCRGSAARRTWFLVLLVASCILVAWGLHIRSYDPRRGWAVAGVASVAAAANLAALTTQSLRMTRRLKLLGTATALLVMLAVLGVWLSLTPQRIGADAQLDPRLADQLRLSRRSLPMLAGALGVLAATVALLPAKPCDAAR